MSLYTLSDTLLRDIDDHPKYVFRSVEQPKTIRNIQT